MTSSARKEGLGTGFIVIVALLTGKRQRGLSATHASAFFLRGLHIGLVEFWGSKSLVSRAYASGFVSDSASRAAHWIPSLWWFCFQRMVSPR